MGTRDKKKRELDLAISYQNYMAAVFGTLTIAGSLEVANGISAQQGHGTQWFRAAACFMTCP